MPQVGDRSNPSLLTELLPEIFFGVLGFIYLIFVCVFEKVLFDWLRSRAPGDNSAMPGYVLAWLLVVGSLGVLYGVCFIRRPLAATCSLAVMATGVICHWCPQDVAHMKLEAFPTLCFAVYVFSRVRVFH